MKKYFISIILALTLNISFAQLNILSNGFVGVGAGATTPSEQFQIGDRWTFMNGGTKVIGYNVKLTTTDTRMVSDYASCIRMDLSGIKFGVAGTGAANSSISWKFPLWLKSDGDFVVQGKLSTTDYIFNAGTFSSSDERLKENIKPIANATDIINSLNGKTYNLKSDNLKNANGTKRNSYGLIAQELEKVLPDLVAISDDSTKLLAVNYDGLIPILIEAFKEQKLSIDSLKQIISNNSLKNASILTTNLNDLAFQARLFQNSPNPFSQSTKIEYYLPEMVQNAKINIYDLNGLQIKSITIANKGKGTVTVNGYELRPGMYLYTLIADDKEIETKRMILMQ